MPETVERSLRDYQAEAIERLRDSLRSGHRRPLMQAPTGSGKTRIAAEIVNMARTKGNRVVFVVPALSLIDQTIGAFGAEGIRDIGVMQAQHALTDFAQPVQIASVQTLMRRELPFTNLIVIDEAHRHFKFVEEWMKRQTWERVPFIGLSATPWTKGLGKHYDDLIIVTTTEELIKRGYLAPFRVFAPSHPDLKGVRKVAGDFHEGDLSKAMNKPTLTADVVETWLRKGEGRPTLVFGVDRAHAKALQERFEAAGIASGYQDMNTSPVERMAMARALVSRELRVICNVETMTIGVDIPEVACISIARPTHSRMLHTQILGRGLRIASGKSDLIVLDHADNHLRLGFVTDPVPTQLDDGTGRQATERKGPLPKDCPACGYVMQPGTRKCPFCDFEPKHTPRMIKSAEGELVELTKTQKKRQRSKTIQLGIREIPLGEFYGELQSYAANHGFKPGWAANQYRAAVGVWPNAYKWVMPLPVSMEVSSYCKAMLLRFAKGRERKEATRYAAD